MFLSQLPSTAAVASTFPQEMGSVRGCGIRGRGERAVKSQVVPFPAFRCRLRNVSFLSLGKKEKVSAADVERQM